MLLFVDHATIQSHGKHSYVNLHTVYKYIIPLNPLVTLWKDGINMYLWFIILLKIDRGIDQQTAGMGTCDVTLR